MRRSLRLLWLRYFVPGPLEHEPLFRATMVGLTRRGLAVAGWLGVAGALLYLGAHLAAGKTPVWTFEGIDRGTHVVVWNKVMILLLGLVALALSRRGVGIGTGRAVMAALLVGVAWVLVLEDYGRADFTFTAGWLTLVMLTTVGTVPFQPWQTAALCAVVSALYAAYAVQPPIAFGAAVGPGPSGNPPVGLTTARIVFLGLVTVLCAGMSASLYQSRHEQYRALRRVGRLKERLAARSRALEGKSAALEEKSTALEQSLARLSAAQSQLVQREKLASLGQLTAGIAHEIKNPLNFVNNFAQLAAELTGEIQDEVGERREETVGAMMDDVGDLFDDLALNVAKIAEHGRRADGIVRNMLAHARATPGPRREADLNRLLEEDLNLAWHGLRAEHREARVDLVRELDPAVGAIEMVPEEIGRVFLNLLDNAFYAVRRRAEAAGQAGGEGYVPTVTVRSRRLPGAAGVEVQIADNGIGMPPDVRDHIFEPFFTTKPTGEGTGLGLSLAYDIVTAAHGGTMAVESAEGVGTTFTLVLPERLPERLAEGPAEGPLARRDDSADPAPSGPAGAHRLVPTGPAAAAPAPDASP